MMDRIVGRNIAGQILIEMYGLEYLTDNIKKLDFVESLDNGILKVHFGIFKHNLDECPPVEKDGGIYVGENEFPKTLLNVKINLRDGTAEIIDK